MKEGCAKATEQQAALAWQLLERATVAILVTRSDGRLTYVNSAACQLLGYRPEELLEKEVEILEPEPSFSDRLAVAKRTFQGQLSHKEGNRIRVEIRAEVLEWSGERCLCAYIRDVQQELNLEAQLAQSQKLEAIGRLAGGIAHDFNNILTIVTGYTGLLLEELQPEDRHGPSVREIQLAAERGAELVRQILIFGRRQVIEPRLLSPNNVVAQMEPMIRRLIGEDIDFVTKLSPDVGLVYVDPAQFEQVIMNLCVNAKDAMPEGGRMIVETDNVDLDELYAGSKAGVKPGRYVRLAVNDTGVGIEPEIRSKIFEPFFTTKAREKGSGLGLATAYGVVKRAGGNIWCYSEPGNGSVFKVYLPQVEGSVSEEEIIEEVDRPIDGSGTVLLVEDDQQVRRLLQLHLKSLGYRVLSVGTPTEAREVARANSDITLLLTDLVLPEINGRALADEVSTILPGVNTLFMSGYSEGAVAAKGRLSNMPFIQKPFGKRALAAKLRAVQERST